MSGSALQRHLPLLVFLVFGVLLNTASTVWASSGLLPTSAPPSPEVAAVAALPPPVSTPSPTISATRPQPSSLPQPNAVGAGGAAWNWQNPLPQGNTFMGVSCLSATLCVAVTEYGTLLRYDGIGWLYADLGPNPLFGFYAVSCRVGLCVAVGNSVSGSGIVTSVDGSSWLSATTSGAYNLNGVACQPGLCVAVGDFGEIVTSTDGVSWVTATSSTTKHLYGISCRPGLCVAVGSGGPNTNQS